MDEASAGANGGAGLEGDNSASHPTDVFEDQLQLRKKQELESQELSNRKKKVLTRLSVTELKQIAPRPEVVEVRESSSIVQSHCSAPVGVAAVLCGVGGRANCQYS